MAEDLPETISVLQLAEMFPDEETARKRFEAVLWADGRYCPSCGSTNTHEAQHAKCPYRCRDCKKYFSVKTGTVMASSPVPLRKWLFAIFLDITSPKGISAMKLHRDIDVGYKTAWFMLHRIREGFRDRDAKVLPMRGPVEVDETFVGGKKRNMHGAKRRSLGKGRGSAHMATVIGVKDRPTNTVRVEVIESANAGNMQGFVRRHVEPGASVYTDEAQGYAGLREYQHRSVSHSRGEYVRGDVHTNGIEAFWSMFKRAHKGTYHYISPKHLQRYVSEFAVRHGLRGQGTRDQLRSVICAMVGRRLTYRELVASE